MAALTDRISDKYFYVFVINIIISLLFIDLLSLRINYVNTVPLTIIQNSNNLDSTTRPKIL